MHQLGSYVKFFNILRDLEDTQQIDNKQRKMLKINFTTKEKQLMNILEYLDDEDEEDIKFSLLNYVKGVDDNQKPTIRRVSKRSRSSITDITPLKGLQMDDSQVDQNNLLQELEQASKTINLAIGQQKQGDQIYQKIMEILDSLQKFSNASTPKIQRQISRSNTFYQDMNLAAEQDLSQVYKDIKQQFVQYIHSHLLLMDENVSYLNIVNLLQQLLKHLINIDQFSFINIQSDMIEVYQSKIDQFDQFTLTDQLRDEIISLPQQKVFKFDTQLQLSKFLGQNYHRSYALILNQQIIIFHQSQKYDYNLPQFMEIVNEYQLFDEMCQLSQFLIDTVQHARVQFFSPLSISDMIIDIGISFVRCSKFLLIEAMFRVIMKYYKTEKLTFDSGEQAQFEPDHTYVQFKDKQIYVVFKINSMNIAKQSDQRIYDEVRGFYDKYLRFITQCYDKSAFYKFFLRSNDSLIFEFDKSGRLVFLSRPIPKQIKEQFNINFNGTMIQNNHLSYTKIFDPLIVSNIENYLQDQRWKVKKDNLQYEIFLKIEEKSYKGFAVIFTESANGWIKDQIKMFNNNQNLDSRIQAKIRKQIIQNETLNFVNKLEENNPEMRQSVASLYMPLSQSQFKKAKSIQHIASIEDITPSRRSEIPQKSKFQQFQQGLDLYNFQIETTDDIVDQFSFNVLMIKNPIQKHRAVWSILKKNGFIDDYSIPIDNLQKFIKDIEYHYNANSNPYHNYDHGITVMQMSHYISTLLKQYQNILDNFQIFTLLISALCHDVGHTGRTNLFEIHSLSELAVRYHDKSVLEQHHAALTVSILKNSQSNLLINLNQEQFRNFRKGLIQNILNTDMSEHFRLLKDFENRPQEFNDTKLLSGYIMHISDFGGTVKKYPISQEWSHRVNQEFIQQFIIEGQMGYPQLPYMKDLDKAAVMAKSEIGFLKVIVRPSYLLLSEFLDNRLQHCIQNIDETIQQWEKILKKQEDN
ncbi:hypothetical protein pb186bvf_015748 [Paramecium bursaria]